MDILKKSLELYVKNDNNRHGKSRRLAALKL